MRAIEASSQMAQHKSPGLGRYSSAIEAHCPFGSKYSYWRNKALVLIKPRNDFLSHKCARRHMMGPPQAVDISCQAFTPGGSNFVGTKIIKPTTSQDMLLWEHIVPGISDLYCHMGLLRITHPAASCSSGMAAPPISSRTGPRFPDRPCGLGDEGCFSSCIRWEVSDRGPLNPKPFVRTSRFCKFSFTFQSISECQLNPCFWQSRLA